MNTDFAKNAARKLVAVVRHSPRIVAVIGVGIGCAWLFTPRPDVSRQAAEEVLAAVRAWPEDRGNINAASSRRACKRLKDGIFVSGLGMINNVDRSRMALPVSGYNLGTVGTYFGGGPSGIQPGEFIQALMDAGVVKRVSVQIVTHIHQPSSTALSYIPLQDTMGGGPPTPPAQQFVDRDEQNSVDLFIGTGHEAGWFAANPALRANLMGIAPPMTRVVPVRDISGNAVIPAGVVAPDGLCYPLRADRVLEYTDVRPVAYKAKEITVAILMKPKEMPQWVSDHRVFEGLADDPVLPEDVHFWTFRNTGDGWHRYVFADLSPMTGKGHYIGN